MMAHLVFLLVFFSIAISDNFFSLSNILFQLFSISLLILSLFISHGYSFYKNYIQKGEYETATVDRLMREPYGRIIVMHLAILLGAFATMGIAALLNQDLSDSSSYFSIGQALVLIILKTIFDIRGHINEHKKYSAT
jgi:hypothetical protein